MNRTTIILLGLFVLLAGGTAFYFSNKPKERVSSVVSDRDFAVRDISKVKRIFIADRMGNTVDLQKEGNIWMYNKKYKAHQNNVALILEMLKNVEIRYQMNDKEAKNAVKSLATNGIKVEAYGENDEKLKVFYVGGMTNDERGTYMIMEGAEEPYVTHMPFFMGNLRDRFLKPQTDDWRDKMVLDYPKDDIESLTLIYPKQRNKSFIIEKKGATYSIEPYYETTTPIKGKANQSKITAYLSEFQNLNGESFENNYSKKEKVLNQVPFCELHLELKGGKERHIRFFPKATLDGAGNPIPASDNLPFERYFMDVDGEDFMLCQVYTFGKLFVPYESFY